MIDAPDTPENRTLGRITAAIQRGSGDIDEKELWSLSQEALGLLNALVERRLSRS